MSAIPTETRPLPNPPPSPKDEMRPRVVGQPSEPTAFLPWKVKWTHPHPRLATPSSPSRRWRQRPKPVSRTRTVRSCALSFRHVAILQLRPSEPSGRDARKSAGRLGGGDPQLAGLGRDLVLERGRGLRVHRRVGPAAAPAGLAEDRDLDGVGPQRAIHDQHVDLQTLVRALGRLVPVGDDQPAERVGRGERHEVQRLERAAPEVGVDADPAAAAVGAGLLALLAAEERETVLAGDGPELVAQPLLVRAVLAKGGIFTVAAAGQRRAEDTEEEHRARAANDPGHTVTITPYWRAGNGPARTEPAGP